MLFQIIRATDSAILETCGTQDYANLRAQRLSEQTGQKHYAKRAPDTNWRAREESRFLSGEYEPLPFENQLWFLNASKELRDHFAHKSKEKDAMVAFTESPEKGEQDRQTRVKCGVYLTRFFGDVLTPREIQDWTRLFYGEAENEITGFELARTPDEVEDVYLNGPASCMSGTGFDGEEHPSRVYGDSDLAVAYIRKPSDYHDEPIASRAVIWPEKKLYGRIYPTPERYDSGSMRESANREHDRLLRALKREGYEHGDFSGAYIRAIEGPRDDSYIMPYLDGGYSVSLVMRDGEDFFRLGHREAYSASDTCGVLYLNGRAECEHCGDAMPEDDSYTVHVNRYDTQQWCEHCYGQDTFYCHGNDESYSSRAVDEVEGPDGQSYSIYYAENYFSFCEYDEVWCDSDDIEHVWTSTLNQESWGLHARENHAFKCAATGWHSSEKFESVEIDGETYERDYALNDLILSASLREQESEEANLESTEG